MSWTAVYAFANTLPSKCTSDSVCHLQSMYTFNFRYLSPDWVGTGVVLLPLLAVLTNFPLIAITLRDNMIVLFKVAFSNHTSRPADSAESRSLLQPPVASDEVRVLTPDMRTGHAMAMDSTSGGDVVPAARQARMSRTRRLSSAAQLKEELLAEPAGAAHPNPALTVRVAVALCAVSPPFLVAFVTDNIDLVVRVTGSYGGAVIMFVMPVLFVWHARKALRGVQATAAGRVNNSPAAGTSRGNAHRDGVVLVNPHASPFQHPLWYVLTIGWAVSAVVVNTYSFVRG